MSEFSINQEIWENIYRSGQSILRYPNENLVRLLMWLKSKGDLNVPMKALDLGFGSGNNLEFMASLGLDVFGLEVSDSARNVALRRLPKEFDSTKLKLTKNDLDASIPFEDHQFDIVVCWQVLYYNSMSRLNLVATELKRILKPNGILIATMATDRDVAMVRSKSLGSKFERVIGDDISNQSNARIVILPAESDVKEVFSLFSNVEVGYFESKLMGSTSSHWVITARNN